MPAFLGARRALMTSASNASPSLLDIDLTTTAGGLLISRSAAGTQINAAGQIVSFAANTLRRSNGVGLLVEPSDTNNLVQSGLFTNAAWVPDGATIAASSAVTAPDGSTSSFKLTESASSAEHRIYQNTSALASTAPGKCGFFLKAAERTWARVQALNNVVANFNLSAGVVGTYTAGASPIMVALGNGWFFCAVSGNGPSQSNANYAIFDLGNADMGTGPVASYTGNGTSGAYVWGALYGPGYQLLNYIPTASASVTRDADVVTLPQAGIGRVVLTFDDASQQTFSGLSAATPYSLVAANLNRQTITRLQGFAA